ncbi:CatB-related O-acetyltransferase [Myroides odoratimimus]|uniref:CatB-related O-acetyltransferase n=1 Tax=Myroides odoratimimus TaxID=76832 RepID=UPI003F42C682
MKKIINMIKKIIIKLVLIIRFPFFLFKGNKISFKARLLNNVKISGSVVGRYTYIGCNTVINNTIIGNYCSIAPGVQIGGMEHSHWWYSTSTSLSDHCISNKITHVGHDVWIGAGAIIKQGVKIGNGAVIGAMSFVTKDVEENSIVLGIPAKFYKNRLNEDIFESIKDINFYEDDIANAKAKIKRLTAIYG